MLLLYSSKTLGVAPRKSEKQRRLSRHYFVARKMLSVAWSQAFDIHMRDHFPLLMSSFGLPATGPEVAPFAAISYDAFRRGIHAVGGSCSTDLRAQPRHIWCKTRSCSNSLFRHDPCSYLSGMRQVPAYFTPLGATPRKTEKQRRLFPKYWLLPSLSLASGI